MQCIIVNEGADAENEFNWADANSRIESEFVSVSIKQLNGRIDFRPSAEIQKSCGPQGNFDPYKLAKLRQRASQVRRQGG